jgi:ABC-type sugar transport system ATPase subunit
MKINLKNFSFAFNKELILSNINLEINQGEFISIVGHSGSGKTTLVKIIAGLIKSKDYKLTKQE